MYGIFGEVIYIIGACRFDPIVYWSGLVKHEKLKFTYFFRFGKVALHTHTHGSDNMTIVTSLPYASP